MNHFIKKLEKLKKKRRRMSLARMSQKKVIFFLQIRRDKLRLVHTMLHKLTHNYSALLLEEHLKCSVERSRFTSGGDVIEKKNHTTWELLHLLVTKSHNFLYNAKIQNLWVYEAVLRVFLFVFLKRHTNNFRKYRKHSRHLPQLIGWK